MSRVTAVGIVWNVSSYVGSLGGIQVKAVRGYWPGFVSVLLPSINADCIGKTIYRCSEETFIFFNAVSSEEQGDKPRLCVTSQ